MNLNWVTNSHGDIQAEGYGLEYEISKIEDRADHAFILRFDKGFFTDVGNKRAFIRLSEDLHDHIHNKIVETINALQATIAGQAQEIHDQRVKLAKLSTQIDGLPPIDFKSIEGIDLEQMPLTRFIKDIADIGAPITWRIAAMEGKALNDAILIRDLTKSPWISVDDQLPKDKDQWLLVSDGSAMVTMAWWEGPNGIFGWKQLNYCECPNVRESAVTHWMPLPANPPIN